MCVCVSIHVVNDSGMQSDLEFSVIPRSSRNVNVMSGNINKYCDDETMHLGRKEDTN